MRVRSRAAQALAGRAALVLVAVIVTAPQLAAAVVPGGIAPPQSGRNLERPPTWEARYDSGDAERVHLVMRPGWHINPGPAGIFWDASRFAEGNFSISSTIFLFPAGSGDPPARVDEPYGVLFGGVDLDGEAPAYTTFLLRNDGSFRVARHSGGTSQPLIEWTDHEAIATWAEGDEGTASNTLAINVTAAEVTFWVNDQQVGALPRGNVNGEGIVGLRAGDDVSLHISDLVIGPNRR